MAAIMDEAVNEKNISLFTEALDLSDTQELPQSLQRLYDRGCAEISSVTKVKEEGGWIYCTAVSTDQQLFYIDMNRHGAFGTILSQDGKDNADYLVKTLGLKENRYILYSSELLETFGCGRIESVKDVVHKRAYRFSIINSENKEFHIRMSDEGSISVISDENNQPIYGMKE